MIATAAADTPHAGLSRGLSFEEYSRIKAANFSILKHFSRSAAHARQEMIAPRETKALDFGHAYHVAILEPDRFQRDYVRGLDGLDMRFKESKTRMAEFQEQHKDKTVLLEKEWDQIAAMQAAIYAHGTAAELLHAQGGNELTAVWLDSETGQSCKGRIDRFCSWMGWTFIVDLKTTTNASPRGWPKEVANFAYHEQAAFYLSGLAALDERPRRFLHIAQEKDPPYAVGVYELDDAALAEGRALWRRHLRAYAAAMDEGIWTAYPDGIMPCELPRWAFRATGTDE